MKKLHHFGEDGKHVPEHIGINNEIPIDWILWKLYLDEVKLMSVPGSLGKWVGIVHDTIESTIF